MNSEIINIYIEKLVLNLTELTKTNVLLSAQLEFANRINAELNNRIAELEVALDKAKASKSKKAESDF